MSRDWYMVQMCECTNKYNEPQGIGGGVKNRTLPTQSRTKDSHNNKSLSLLSILSYFCSKGSTISPDTVSFLGT